MLPALSAPQLGNAPLQRITDTVSRRGPAGRVLSAVPGGLRGLPLGVPLVGNPDLKAQRALNHHARVNTVRGDPENGAIVGNRVNDPGAHRGMASPYLNALTNYGQPVMLQMQSHECHLVGARQAEDLRRNEGFDQVVVDRGDLEHTRFPELAFHVVFIDKPVAAVGIEAYVGRLPARL